MFKTPFYRQPYMDYPPFLQENLDLSLRPLQKSQQTLFKKGVHTMLLIDRHIYNLAKYS